MSSFVKGKGTVHHHKYQQFLPMSRTIIVADNQIDGHIGLSIHLYDDGEHFILLGIIILPHIDGEEFLHVSWWEDEVSSTNRDIKT